MGMNGFKDLVVWQESKDLAVQMHRLSQQGKLGKDFGLSDQIRRSAVSVASNLAEGDEQGTNKGSGSVFLHREGFSGRTADSTSTRL